MASGVAGTRPPKVRCYGTSIRLMGPYSDEALLDLVVELVAMPSPSREEGPITDLIEARLRAQSHLTVDRIGDNVVARTQLDRGQRLVLAGHTDTVPAVDNAEARLEGDILWGVGSTDMKGGIGVMVALAESVPEPNVDLTFVFYAREEIAASESGLLEILAEQPSLLDGDVALLGEPTSAGIEAGCQGTMRIEVVLRGARSHTARPWMGRNAIHRLGPVLDRVAAFVERQPTIAGCTFREALQAVSVTGGVAGNVVPDEVTLLLNRRFAPDRTADEAYAEVLELLGDAIEEGDTVTLVDVADAATPATDHPLVKRLISDNDLRVAAKLGWTDVARFAGHGVPAANFGPGDASLAHTPGEFLRTEELFASYKALFNLLTTQG